MTVGKRNNNGGLSTLLGAERVRRTQHDGRTLYPAVDVVGALTNSRQPEV